MYVGLISDTHCVFDDRLREFLQPVDEVWHAGDFGNVATRDIIADFKPLKGVYGNCDNYCVRQVHPEFLCFDADGIKTLMIHIGGYPGHYDHRALQLISLYEPKLFVCGHSHILKVMYDKTYGMMDLNPGAAGVLGFHEVRTALRFRIDNGKMHDMEVGQWPRTFIEPIEDKI
jgi:Predicted phosphoesterase